MKRFVELTDF